MFQRWVVDLFSPSNLWTLAQFCFPAGTALVSAWLSYLWSLPPSVTMFLAVLTGFLVFALVAEAKVQTIFRKLSLESVEIARLVWNRQTQRGFIQLMARFGNKHQHHPMFFRVELLNHTIQGHAHVDEIAVGDINEIAPTGERGFVFLGVNDITYGPVNGRLHFVVHYGKTRNNLKYRFEKRIRLNGNVLAQPNNEATITFNWLIQE